MDPDNLERLLSIIDLLDRFKQRMTQATQRKRASISLLRSSKEGLLEMSAPSAGSQDLEAFGSRELERTPTIMAASRMNTLTTMMSKGRSLAFMTSGVDKRRRTSVHFGGGSSDEDLDEIPPFQKMIQRSMSRAMSRAFSKRSMSRMDRSMSKMDRSLSRSDRSMERGLSIIDRKFERQKTDRNMDLEAGISPRGYAPKFGSSGLQSSSTGSLIGDDSIDIVDDDNDDGFSKFPLPARQSFLDHKFESGLFSDPEPMSDTSPLTTPRMRPAMTPASIIPKKKRRTSVMFADISSIGSDSQQILNVPPPSRVYEDSQDSSSVEVKANFIEEFGEDAVMHVAAANPEVLQQLFNKITEYVKNDLGRLLDELLAKMQQTDLRLQQTEQHLTNAIEKAEAQEVEVSQMTQELKDLRRIRDEGIRKAKLLKYNIDELETTKGKLLNVEARAELQRMEMLRIQKTKEEEIGRLRDAYQEKEFIQVPTSQPVELADAGRRRTSEQTGILKLPTRGRRASALDPLVRQGETTFTFNVRRDVSPCETESETSQPNTPRQSFLIDEMVGKIAELEIQLRIAQTSTARMEELEKFVEDLNEKLLNASHEKLALETYIASLEAREYGEDKMKESEDLMMTLRKEKEDAELEAIREREEADAARASRDQLLDQLKFMRDEFEKERREMREKYQEELDASIVKGRRIYSDLEEQHNETLRLLGISESELSKFHDALRRAEKDVEEVTVQLNKVIAEKTEALTSLERMAAELEVKQIELESTRNELRSLRISFQELLAGGDETKLLQDSLDALQGKFDTLSIEYERAEAQILELTEKLDLLREKEEQLRDAEQAMRMKGDMIMGLQKELADMASEKNRILTDLQTKLAEIESQRDALLLELVKTSGTRGIESLSCQIEDLQDEIARIQAEEKERIESLEEEISNLKHRLGLLSGGERMDERIVELEEELERRNERMGQLEIEKEDQSETIRNLKGEMKLLSDRLESSDRDRDRAIGNIELLRNEIERERTSREEDVSKLMRESALKDQTIIELNDVIQSRQNELNKVLSELDESRTLRERMSSSTEEELLQELELIRKNGQRLSQELENKIRELESTKEELRRQSDYVTNENEKRLRAERELTEQRQSFVNLIEEFKKSAEELRSSLSRKDKEHAELSETCAALSSTVQHLEDERTKKQQTFDELQLELNKLRAQFGGLRSDRKTTEEQLALILSRLEGREVGSVELNERISELQKSLRQTEEALEAATKELMVERSKTSLEYDSRLSKLDENITRVIESRDMTKSLWLARVDQFQKENGQLRARLATLTALLSSLNERLIQLQVASNSQCCPLLSCCCPNTNPSLSSLDLSSLSDSIYGGSVDRQTTPTIKSQSFLSRYTLSPSTKPSRLTEPFWGISSSSQSMRADSGHTITSAFNVEQSRSSSTTKNLIVQ